MTRHRTICTALGCNHVAQRGGLCYAHLPDARPRLTRTDAAKLGNKSRRERAERDRAEAAERLAKMGPPKS